MQPNFLTMGCRIDGFVCQILLQRQDQNVIQNWPEGSRRKGVKPWHRQDPSATFVLQHIVPGYVLMLRQRQAIVVNDERAMVVVRVVDKDCARTTTASCKKKKKKITWETTRLTQLSFLSQTLQAAKFALLLLLSFLFFYFFIFCYLCQHSHCRQHCSPQRHQLPGTGTLRKSCCHGNTARFCHHCPHHRQK